MEHTEITLDEMVKEMARENALRRNLYPQWKQKASEKRKAQYDRQLAISEAIEKHLRLSAEILNLREN
jgi:hypothetical protein